MTAAESKNKDPKKPLRLCINISKDKAGLYDEFKAKAEELDVEFTSLVWWAIEMAIPYLESGADVSGLPSVKKRLQDRRKRLLQELSETDEKLEGYEQSE